MKLNLLDTLLRSSIKFVLPGNCQDEIIDYHYLIIRNNVSSNLIKLKSKLKLKTKNKKL